MACGYGIHHEEQSQILANMEKCIEEMRVKGKQSLLPFQKGILVSISSIRGLYQEISDEGKICLLTAHCNSDPSENFFSCIRTLGVANDHPGPVDCMNRIRLLVMSRDAQIVVKNSSVEIEPTEGKEADVNPCASLFNQPFKKQLKTES